MNPGAFAEQTPPLARPYTSALRERQAEQTRQLIFQALLDQLADAGFRDFNIPCLARRAGVSVRTVYRYFPTRDGLLDAFAVWADAQIGDSPALPANPEALAGQARAAFAAFDDHEATILAQWATPAGREVRERGRRRRVESYRAVLRDVTANLPPAEARAALAVIAHLMSSWAWKTFREEFGMSGPESGAAVAWALSTLIADLRSRNTEAAISAVRKE
ncbi:MAG TPA: helix-turn-helix domain-containing protein [Dehalococcoidia bacterium]|nr:helix-turn-helix domain-containing protein [Dehalococcoidia bacterium]